MATRVAGSKHYFKSGGSAYFYTWVEYEITSQTESGTYYRWRRGVYSYGDWAGSTLQFDDWCKGKSLTSGSSGSEVATTSWTTGAYLAYGSSRKFSWAAGYYGSSSTHEATLSTTWKPSTPTWTPNAPSGLSHARVSDAKNALSWTNNPTTTRPYSSIKVERSVDGGSWSQIASLSGTATSYGDASTSANHSYRYRLRACNSAGNSSYTSATAATYNTPAAPSSVSAAVKSGTEVTVTVANPANTATSLELQKSADGSEWSDVATVAGSPVESLDADLGGGEFWLRARNLRGSLASSWTVSAEKTVTECPPGPPSLLRPASSAVIPKSQETIEFAWLHSPVDGSAQTAAQLACRAQGAEEWTVLDVEGAAQSAEAENLFEADSSAEWRARTRGSHADWGEWSAAQPFHVRTSPQVSFEEPADGFVVEAMPLSVRLSYIDDAWALAQAVLTIAGRDGTEAYRRDMGDSLECSIGASDWLPENGAEYTLSVTVRSTSTLQSSSLREVAVDFLEPVAATLSATPDEETGAVTLVVAVGEDAEAAPAASVSVYRVSGGNRVLLAEGVQDGAAVVDRYAPVNAPYSYEAVTFAESGSLHVESIPYEFASPWFYVMRGNLVAKAMWDPSETVSLERPEMEYVRYAGREWPVMYDTRARSDRREFSAVVVEASERDAWAALAESGGECVYKSGDGSVFECGVDGVRLEPSLRGLGYYGSVSVSLTRTGEGAL